MGTADLPEKAMEFGPELAQLEKKKDRSPAEDSAKACQCGGQPERTEQPCL